MTNQFTDIYRYNCPVCGETIDGEYDETDDTTTCTSCGKVLKVGDGIAGSDVETEGELVGKLYLICPICHAETDEDAARRGEGCFTCPTCGFMGKHEGGLE